MKDYFLKPSGGDRAAYLNYLLERLTEFRKARGQHGYLNVHITRTLTQRQLPWALDDETHFEETCAFIQAKINNTILGRINASKGRASYHSFAHHGKPKSSVGSASDCSARSAELETHASGDDVSQTPDNFPGQGQSAVSRAGSVCGGRDSQSCSESDEAATPEQSTELVGSVATSAASSPDFRPQISDSRLTTKSLELGAWRARMLKAARGLMRATAQPEGPSLPGLSQRATADALGVSLATLNRLVNDFKHLTDEQITPENCAADFANTGRRSRWEKFAEQPDVVQKLQELYLLSCGASTDQATRGRRTGSAAATLEIFALDPLCPPDLARVLEQGKQPTPLLNVIRKINDLHEQQHRGNKHASLNGSLTQRCELTEIMPDGSVAPINLGDWWVFDDMSDNFPHHWEGPENQALLGRQGLYCYDQARHWIGVDKIGTVRDSFTAAIVLRFMRQLMQTFGKPRRGIVLEQGVFMANTIRGVRLTTSGDVVDEVVEREAMSAEEKFLLQRGIEALGITVRYTHTPRGKIIEGAFNYLQKIKPMLARRRGVNIGRHAGEYEYAAKQVRRVRAESHTPGELGFLHIEESLTFDLQVMEWINQRTARRLKRSVEYPALRPLSTRDLAVFLPEKRELEIRNGKLTATVAGLPLDFCNPEMFASLGSGYRFALAFDPSEPTLGAALFNRETSSSNFNRWQLGEFVGWADFLAPLARFDWREGEGIADPQADMKRRFNKHIRTAFGAVGLNHRSSTARDGKGNVATVSGGSPQPVAAPLQLPRRVAEPALVPRITQDSYAEMFGG